VRLRKRIRMAGFDYCSPRYYFVTICVNNNIHSFGIIENGTIHLSANGIIALEQWVWLGNQYPYIELISFIVMPDHVHGVIFINSDYYNGYDVMIGNVVGNGRDHSLHCNDQNPIKIKPLPELIGAYKTTVSKRIHLFGDNDFKWQKSYHDRIIRDTKSLNKIIEYIELNPENWNKPNN
jgi:putative transposase